MPPPPGTMGYQCPICITSFMIIIHCLMIIFIAHTIYGLLHSKVSVIRLSSLFCGSSFSTQLHLCLGQLLLILLIWWMHYYLFIYSELPVYKLAQSNTIMTYIQWIMIMYRANEDRGVHHTYKLEKKKYSASTFPGPIPNHKLSLNLTLNHLANRQPARCPV